MKDPSMEDEKRDSEVGGEVAAPSEEERALLRARAAALARTAAGAEVAESLETVVFRLGGERYAIELHCLQQIFPLRNLAFLPGAQPPVVGLTPWRGELLPVLDLGAALGRPAGGIADRGRVLVLGGGDRAEFGILIDVIDEIRSLDTTAIRPLPRASDEESQPLHGVTADALLVLDGEELIRNFV